MIITKEVTKIRKAPNITGKRVIFRTPINITRYLIFEMLVKQPKLTAYDIAESLKLSLPLAFSQLKALEQINILEKEKRGQKLYYKFKADNVVAQAIINY
jgi:DNA-binding transcriptional ArsR family regulator